MIPDTVFINEIALEGGYDAFGAYYGAGWPVYQASFEQRPDRDTVFRAVDKEDAEDALRKLYPSAELDFIWCE